MNESGSDRRKPLIAMTSDLMIRKDRPTAYLTMTYVQSILSARCVPVILPPMPMDEHLIDRFDGFVLTGGDDPRTEAFGYPTHEQATPVLPDRQQFETDLLSALVHRPEIPVLGICLGMQMMALCSKGVLNQHLPETHDSHATHWGNVHRIESEDPTVLASGLVWSKHRQAVSDPGSLRVLAYSPDGIVEAIDDPDRKFYLGVQWHPERTPEHALGQGVVDRFVCAVRSGRGDERRD